jgi:hypothetical protein
MCGCGGDVSVWGFFVADVYDDLIFDWILDDVHFDFVAVFICEMGYFPGDRVYCIHFGTYSCVRYGNDYSLIFFNNLDVNDFLNVLNV